MISHIISSMSVISGLMSVFLFLIGAFFEKDKKKSSIILFFGCLFLLASFSEIEYALWLEGINIFDLIKAPIVPFVFYFVVWIIFIIWIFESRNQRKYWVFALLILSIIILISINCMNCLSELLKHG